MATIEGCSGEGVEIPLPVVVVVGGGVVDVVLRVDEEVVTAGLVELVDVVVLIGVVLDLVIEVTAVEVVDGSGGGSLFASTQYDLPTSRSPQSAVMDGFWFSQHLSSHIDRGAYPSTEVFKRDEVVRYQRRAVVFRVQVDPPTAVLRGVGIIRK